MAYWSVFLWIPERHDWKVMFPIVRHFSKPHLVFKLSKAVRPYLPDFIPGYRSHSVPALSSLFRYHSAVREPNPKLIEMLPLTSRSFGWDHMSLGHKVSDHIELLPLLSLVSRQRTNLFPSLLPSAKYLDEVFYEHAASSLLHCTIWKYSEWYCRSDLYCSLVNQQLSLLWLLVSCINWLLFSVMIPLIWTY